MDNVLSNKLITNHRVNYWRRLQQEMHIVNNSLALLSVDPGSLYA